MIIFQTKWIAVFSCESKIDTDAPGRVSKFSHVPMKVYIIIKVSMKLPMDELEIFSSSKLKSRDHR